MNHAYLKIDDTEDSDLDGDNEELDPEDSEDEEEF